MKWEILIPLMLWSSLRVGRDLRLLGVMTGRGDRGLYKSASEYRWCGCCNWNSKMNCKHKLFKTKTVNCYPCDRRQGRGDRPKGEKGRVFLLWTDKQKEQALSYEKSEHRGQSYTHSTLSLRQRDVRTSSQNKNLEICHYKTWVMIMMMLSLFGKNVDGESRWRIRRHRLHFNRLCHDFHRIFGYL